MNKRRLGCCLLLAILVSAFAVSVSSRPDSERATFGQFVGQLVGVRVSVQKELEKSRDFREPLGWLESGSISEHKPHKHSNLFAVQCSEMQWRKGNPISLRDTAGAYRNFTWQIISMKYGVSEVVPAVIPQDGIIHATWSKDFPLPISHIGYDISSNIFHNERYLIILKNGLFGSSLFGMG